jgi:hypothetical protein
MMQHAPDDLYCALIARRAVARAALHLGIADMTAEALDVLGDVLLEFLERLGRTISHSVEASGRSSAHVHVLDAMRAVEWCTTTAVTQVYSRRGDEHDTSWKGLAAFLFGPEWMHNTEKRSEITGGGGGGGKVGPRSTAQAGWHAPYPEEIPNFPVVSHPALIANPHSLQPKEEELYTIVIEKPNEGMVKEPPETPPVSADDEPETLLQTWGFVLQDDEEDKKKRKRIDETEEPISKKAKWTQDNTQKPEIPDPPQYYLPSYYPTMPQPAIHARTVVVEASRVRDLLPTEDPHQVRLSLVQLEETNWGAVSEGPVVTAGTRTEEWDVQPQIVPLGRASGSRVSRILEGSMDMGP